MNRAVVFVLLIIASSSVSAGFFDRKVPCSDNEYVYGNLTVNDCAKAKQDRADKKRASDEENARLTIESNKKVAEDKAAYDAAHPEAKPDQKFLTQFTTWPLAKRAAAYERMHLITERDFGELSPSDQASIRCMTLAEKVDVQRAYERMGSHGIYNMDNVLVAGPISCRSFIQAMANLKD